jgi:sigma54-dependent transcription regulator
MALGTILSALSNIPWTQVVENAPWLAERAARLWNAVKPKKANQASGSNAKAVLDSALSATDDLKSRLVEMEEHVLRLEEQMATSAELIKVLAEQNTQLVRRIELNSVRLNRLTTATVIGAFILSATIVFLWLRP